MPETLPKVLKEELRLLVDENSRVLGSETLNPKDLQATVTKTLENPRKKPTKPWKLEALNLKHSTCSSRTRLDSLVGVGGPMWSRALSLD